MRHGFSVLLAVATILAASLTGCEEKQTVGEPPIELGLAPGETVPYDESAEVAEVPASPGPAEPEKPTTSEPPMKTDTPWERVEPAQPAQPEVAQTPGMERKAPSYYTIRKGDTLIQLARRFYGDPAKWKEIWDLNRNKISDPNRIYPGTEIQLPQ